MFSVRELLTETMGRKGQVCVVLVIRRTEVEQSSPGLVSG